MFGDLCGLVFDGWFGWWFDVWVCVGLLMGLLVPWVMFVYWFDLSVLRDLWPVTVVLVIWVICWVGWFYFGFALCSGGLLRLLLLLCLWLWLLFYGCLLFCLVFDCVCIRLFKFDCCVYFGFLVLLFSFGLDWFDSLCCLLLVILMWVVLMYLRFGLPILLLVCMLFCLWMFSGCLRFVSLLVGGLVFVFVWLFCLSFGLRCSCLVCY